MWGKWLSQVAAAGSIGLLAAGACSSQVPRDQSYGTDLAQGYRFPDGGYPVPVDARRVRDARADAADGGATDGNGGADAGADDAETVDDADIVEDCESDDDAAVEDPGQSGSVSLESRPTSR